MMANPRADAQTLAAEATPAPVERIEVTGSAIRRTDVETPSPVQTITSEELKRTGYTDVSDVLRNVAANGAGSLSQSFNFAFSGGGSGIALRGLAVGDTLVLINGHRMAPYPLSDDAQRSYVDVSNIPLDAIDHIDILRDGASATYGSDAIAGVVNIILKKTFTGIHASGEYGQTTRGDGGTSHASVLFGSGDLEADGHNYYVALEYRHQDAIYVQARHGLWNADNPASWTQLGGNNITPGVPNFFNNTPATLQSTTGVLVNPTNPAQFTFLPGCTQAQQAAGGCGFIITGMQIQPNTQNMNVTSRFTFKLPAGWETSTEVSFWDSRAEQVQPWGTTVYPTGFVGIRDIPGQPPGLAAGSPFVTTVPANYPGNPYGAAAPLIYTFKDVGNPHTNFDSPAYRLMEDLTGAYFGFDINASAGISYINTSQVASNFINFPNLQTALNNGSYHVGQAAGTNTPATYQFIAPQERFNATDLLDFVDLSAQRDLIQLWGGPLTWAFGAEGYHRSLNSLNAPSVEQGVQAGIISFVIGHQNDVGAFTEFDAHVLKGLEVDAAVRADHQWTDYHTYGNSFKPHLGVKATPIDSLTMRGTWSQGYRIPSPAEAGTSAALFGAGTVADPALCPQPTGTNITGLGYYFPSQCVLNPVNVQTPTKTLSPERSDNYTLGAIFEPTFAKWLFVSGDYFNYKIKNQIWSPFELGGLTVFGNYVRGNPTTLLGSDGVNHTTPVGLILFKGFPYVNASATTITGFDMEVRLKFDFAEFGRLTSDLNATHQFKYDVTTLFGQTFKLAGTQGPSGVSGDTGNPRNRATLQTTWDKGPYEVALNVNWVGRWSINDPSAGQSAPCQGQFAGFSTTYGGGAFTGGAQPNLCYVASWTDFDLHASYKYDKHWTLFANILNIFDRAPSLDISTYGAPGGWYSTLENQGAIGRFVSGGVSYDF